MSRTDKHIIKRRLGHSHQRWRAIFDEQLQFEFDKKNKRRNLENDRNIPFWRENRFLAEDKRQILSPSLPSIHHRHLLLSSRIEDPLLFTFNFFLVWFLVFFYSCKKYVAIYFVCSSLPSTLLIQYFVKSLAFSWIFIGL